MRNDTPFWRVLLTALALGLFLVSNGGAAEKKPGPKDSKPAKSQSKESPPAVRMGLEPKAMDILKASCDRLAAASTMRFTAVTMYENPSLLGVPLAYTTQSEVTLQRPDKLTVITPGDGPATEFYYNGKTMTAFAPAENLIAVSEAPATIDAALQVAYDSAAIYFPFTDVIVADPYKDLADGLTIAFYIGQSNVVGGTTTDMVAYANKEVFVQIWIGVDDKLPRMIRAVYYSDGARLRHQLEFSNWQLGQSIAETTFAAKKTDSATPMPFAHPNQKPLDGKAPVKDQSLKSN